MAKKELQTKGIIFDIGETLLLGRVKNSNAEIILARPGLREAFKWLTDKGVQKGIVSSYSEAGAIALLKQAQIAEYFDTLHIVGTDSVRDLEVDRTERIKASGWRGMLGATQEVAVKKVIDHKIAAKPHPEPVRYLLHDWQQDPSTVVFVGDDMYYDMQCAVSAEVKFMRIPPIGFNNEINLLRFLKDRIQ